MTFHLRVARPVSNLSRAATMYADGLGLTVLGRFDEHEGFTGVMLGMVGADFPIELTACTRHPGAPSPTPEDLLVFYVPQVDAWTHRCAQMRDAGFDPVAAYNPSWDRCGVTFMDPDGYRTVLQHAAWANSLPVD